MELIQYLKHSKKAAIAFSGGVDSSYLMYAAKQANIDFVAYYVKSVFQPQFELDDAVKLAKKMNVKMKVLYLDILADNAIADNAPNRCYLCKKKILSVIKKQAMIDGYMILFDGTNATDDICDRPGMKALTEMEVRSPLRICGMSKTQIRRMSKDAGLFTYNKAAYSCLATRVPTGEKITSQILGKIECSEKALFDMGYNDFRVRTFNGIAKLQFTNEQLIKAFEEREQILAKITPYFNTVLLDLKTR